MPTLTEVPDDVAEYGDQEPDYESLVPGGEMLDLDAFTAPEIEELFHLTQEVKNKHKSPPAGKPTSRGQYADPANYKWPIDAKHIRAAVSYFNHGNKSGYNSSMWATIGRRIAAAANRLIGKGHSFSNGSIATAGSSEEYRLALDIIPAEMRVTVEEKMVNGVPCFQFEAMVIPGDAVSKNTIPGKRGPTYYSARRVKQYAADNNRIIEELAAKGQKVTVYPRHAAALLDASLPMGWVDRYEVRPSKTRPGMEDVWYTATVPLTTEGRDAWMKLRTGLVKYSSLRTFPDNRFQTQPVKVDGRVVEEATNLPIAGIDLVATQPGLPVEPIVILEEAAHPVALEEPMTAPSVPPHAAAVQPPVPAQQNPAQGQQPGAPTPAAGTPQVPQQYATCPTCGADITHHILAAHTQMSAQSQQQQQQPGQGQGQPGQGAQQPAQGGQPPMRGAREEALESENAELKQRLAALTAAQEGKPVSDKQTTPAVEGDGSNAEIAALRAQIAALQAENAASKSALEEATALVKSVAAQKAVNAKISELVSSDKTMGAMMRPIIQRAVEEAEISDPVLVQIKYWELRSQQTELLASRSAQAASFPGFGHVNVAGLEELGTSATGTAGVNSTDGSDAGARKPKYTGFQAELRDMFGRTGAVAPTTWDRAVK